MIPESLIAVLTITFVTGMTQMRKRKVLTRKLSALEALGGITNICSDKTGTLTQGQMVTRKAWIPGVGVYTVNNANDAADPTKGNIELGAAKSQSQIDAEKTALQEKYDRERSSAGLRFDEPAEKQARDQQRAKENGPELDEKPVDVKEIALEMERFLQSCALCNLATVRHNDQENKWQTTGDPTEVALQVFAHRFDQGKKALEAQGWKQLAEYPFDSTVKRMSVAYREANGDQVYIFTKGAVERIIDLCVSVGYGDQKQEMTSELKESIYEQMSIFADQGLRVLAIARKDWNSAIGEKSDVPRDEIEKDLTLLGLAGLYDPPRLETKDAVKRTSSRFTTFPNFCTDSIAECTTAGIKVHMLTGDHPGTATAIAKEVGIVPRDLTKLPKDVADSLVKTATEFDGMTEDEIDAMPSLPLVIARCAPDTKTKMIAALHRRRCYAAMTGDGVNDGPSLQAADVGIAMGLAGSDVAKGASDIVLTDDNFASIVNAIEEGRRMFDNIQKFILHLLTSNVGEVILLICGLGFQDASGFSVFPLSPLQILWINMVTSSFPAFGLGREKAVYNVMTRPPHDLRKGVFTWQVIADMMVYGTLMGMLTLFTFVIVVYGPGNDNLGENCNHHHSTSCDVVFEARAAVFAELTWLILITGWEVKNLRRSMFRLNPFSESRFPFFKDIWANQFLFWSVVLGSLIVFPCIYIPTFNTVVFKHKGITWEWGLVFASLVIYVLGMEAWKAVKRWTGWFKDPGEDEIKSSGQLSLRQGFFSFSRTMSLKKSETGQSSGSKSKSKSREDNSTNVSPV